MNKKLFNFILITFVVGFIFQGLYWYSQNTNYLLLSMWAPALGLIGLGKDALPIIKNLKKISWRYLLLTPVVALLPYVLAQLTFYITDNGSWNSATFHLADNGEGISKIVKASLVLGSEAQSFTYFAVNLSVTILIGTIPTTIIATLGEELGWRGYLQDYMSTRFGFAKGTLFVGLIWAYWHIPANLGGINGTQNIYLTTFVMFPLAVVFMSFVLGWFKMASKSVWVCAFFHGVNNTVSDIYLIKPNSKEFAEITELTCSVLVGLFFLYLLYRDSQNDEKVTPKMA